MNKRNILVLCLGLAAIAITGRLAPHLWNATPLGAIALFTASYFGLRYSVPLVFAVLFGTDLIIGFYDWRIMLFVYGSYLVAIAIGWAISRRKGIAIKVAGVVGASVAFFIVTNFAVWQFGTMYPHDLAGLFEAYVAALPFFRNSLIGDSMYALALFGSYELYLYFSAKRTLAQTRASRAA